MTENNDITYAGEYRLHTHPKGKGSSSFIDITGDRYGRLVAIGYAGKENRRTKWIFICDCGNYHKTGMDYVRDGRTTSCGCYAKEIRESQKGRVQKTTVMYDGTPKPLPSTWNLIDITGKKIDMLRVVAYMGTKNKTQIWKCECDCGAMKDMNGKSIKGRGPHSCGCKRRKIGGMSSNKEYSRYRNMLGRCYDVKNKKYSLYGGQGVTVCERWRSSFNNYYQDMGPRPEGMTLDRKDGKKEYSRENCRWATVETQNQNRSSVRLNKKLVTEIRRLYSQGMKSRDIKKMLKIGSSDNTIYFAATGRTWRNV